jgi:hypothetical protein
MNPNLDPKFMCELSGDDTGSDDARVLEQPHRTVYDDAVRSQREQNALVYLAQAARNWYAVDDIRLELVATADELLSDALAELNECRRQRATGGTPVTRG